MLQELILGASYSDIFHDVTPVFILVEIIISILKCCFDIYYKKNLSEGWYDMCINNVCIELFLKNYFPLYHLTNWLVGQKDGVLHVYVVVSLYITTSYLMAVQRKWHFFIVSVVSLFLLF